MSACAPLRLVKSTLVDCHPNSVAVHSVCCGHDIQRWLEHVALAVAASVTFICTSKGCLYLYAKVAVDMQHK